MRDPVGQGNDAAILLAAKESDLLVCAWGNHGAQRGPEVENFLRREKAKLHILKLTGNGQPGHPLYLRKSLTATPW